LRGDVLTLDEAVRIALDNHPRIKGASERIGAQDAVLGQEMAAYYPTLSLNNSYRTSNSTGGGDSTTKSAFDRVTGQTTLSMILYNFGKREASVQSARETLEGTRHTRAATEDEVVVAAKEAYYGYLAAQALVRVREETVKDRELLVRQARGFYEVGTRPKIDVARAEANLFAARADLIAAQNGLQVALATLRNALGVKELKGQPTTQGLSIAEKAPYSLEEAKQIGFSTRPDLLQFEDQRKAQDQKLAGARRGHLPDILLAANYGRTGSSRTSSETFPLDQSWQVQLNFNIPIFEGFRTTYRVQEALRNYNAIRADEEELRQQVALEVESSYLKLVETMERIKATDAAARAAKENLDLANGRYQVGVGSIIEITEAQTLHTTAQTNYIRSLYDHKVAEAQLLKAIGRR
jgi:TolC family type I secretion outer membrane protein